MLSSRMEDFCFAWWKKRIFRQTFHIHSSFAFCLSTAF